MRKPLDLQSVRAAKELRNGTDRHDVQSEFGFNARILERIELAYADASPDLLRIIERLLDDRQRLRKVISALLRESNDPH
ncbi:MAG: hypothetical protein ABJB01_11510 [Rudaea sp.]